MAFTVRLFGYRGMEQLPVNLPKYFSADSIYQLVQPYEWKDQLAINGLAPDSGLAPIDSNDSKTMILMVQVPDAQAIRYEINPPSRQGGVLAAGVNSPLLAGVNMFYFRGGWSFSAIDAANT